METKHPGPWEQFKKDETRKLILPFLWGEWWLERLVYRLEQSAIQSLVKMIGGLTIIVTVGIYIYEGPKRERDRVLAQETERKTQIYQAWQVINTAAGKGGSGGVYEAILDLFAQGESLEGINLEKAHLANKDLSKLNLLHGNFIRANLFEANLFEASLHYANLSGANLYYANLSGANLEGANLSKAMLAGADLSEAYLFNADLRQAMELTCDQLSRARNWESSYRDEALACGAPIPE